MTMKLLVLLTLVVEIISRDDSDSNSDVSSHDIATLIGKMKDSDEDIPEEAKQCFKNHPYPCGLKYSDYPWTDVQLTTYQKDVHVPAGYPQLEKEKYRGFLGDIKMLKLFVKMHVYNIPVTVYTPNRAHRGLRAGVFYVHGGGWALGSSDEMEGVISKLVIDGNFVVFSVDYRLAPEHVFPAGFRDCVMAARHFLYHAARYGVDAHRVAIMGDSSGGNLAAAVALRFRDIDHKPRLKLQVLVYPALQALNFNTPSYQRNACDAYLDRPWMIEFWLWYALGNYPSEWLPKFTRNEHTPTRIRHRYASRVNIADLNRSHVNLTQISHQGSEQIWAKVRRVFRDPYFAPLMSSSLRDLPSTYMMLTSQDVLHDDGEMYARRLRRDGVSVRVATWNSLHALVDDPSYAYAARAIREMTDYMVQALAPPGSDDITYMDEDRS